MRLLSSLTAERQVMNADISKKTPSPSEKVVKAWAYKKNQKIQKGVDVYYIFHTKKKAIEWGIRNPFIVRVEIREVRK